MTDDVMRDARRYRLVKRAKIHLSQNRPSLQQIQQAKPIITAMSASVYHHLCSDTSS